MNRLRPAVRDHGRLMKAMIYEVTFGGSGLDASDDSMCVSVECVDKKRCEVDSDYPLRMFTVPIDAVWDWVMEFLCLPDITEETSDVIDGVLYPYLERTHYYTGKVTNSMLENLSKHAKSDQKPVEE